MIWSHCEFQGVPPSSTFFTSIGVGGAGLMACASKAAGIGMQNVRHTMNHGAFSIKILTFSLRHASIPHNATRLVTAPLEVLTADHSGAAGIFLGTVHMVQHTGPAG